MIGPNNDELQAFLAAYKCSSEDQSETPPIMYSFGILPNYSNNNTGKLGHSTGEISSISLNTDISAESKKNFNFLLKLSEIELTPFGILILAKKIEFDLHSNFAVPNIKDIYYLVLDHFYRFGPISDFYKVNFKVEHYCNLVNFMLQLMNRVKKSPNSSDYFVEAKFSTELEQKLGEFHQLEDEYSKYCNKNDVVRKINEYQDFLHFAEAVHVNWNPYKELLITLKTFKYVYFCSKKRLGYFGRIIERFDQKNELWNDLQNYKELMAIERKGTENDDKNAFDFIVILNAELEKAKTFCIGKI
uniref:Uncharacterized protein n=1 Tax=Globodera rostochiensis TaxID=31243 RepID=A0A914IEN0_GLORO